MNLVHMLSKENILNQKLKVWTKRPERRHDCHVDGVIYSIFLLESLASKESLKISKEACNSYDDDG